MKNLLFYSVIILFMLNSCSSKEKKDYSVCNLYLGYKFVSLLEAPPTKLPDTVDVDISKYKAQLIIHSCEGDADLYIFNHGKREFIGSYIKSNILDSIYIKNQQLSSTTHGKYVSVTYPYMNGCWKFDKFLDVYDKISINLDSKSIDSSFMKIDTVKKRKDRGISFKQEKEKKTDTIVYYEF